MQKLKKSQNKTESPFRTYHGNLPKTQQPLTKAQSIKAAILK